MIDEIEEEIIDFKIESFELCEISESVFLKLDAGENFKILYDELFRAFHTLKGAAGMFGFANLQAHMHNLESLLESIKDNEIISKAQIDYFLNGVDSAKKLIGNGTISFHYLTIEEFKTITEVNGMQSPPRAIIESKEVQKPIAINPNGMMYIIDDEEDVAEILSDFMKNQGFTVKTFHSGKSALEEIENDGPDAILIDMKMLGISGLDFIKICNEEKYDIPIVLISGFLTKETRINALANGAFALIEKPFDNERDLAHCVSAVKQRKIMKLLNKSINYIMYQFSDLDNFLKQQGKDSLRATLKTELATMLELKRNLKSFQVNTK
jgi:FixJ family two-component response regulator